MENIVVRLLWIPRKVKLHVLGNMYKKCTCTSTEYIHVHQEFTLRKDNKEHTHNQRQNYNPGLLPLPCTICIQCVLFTRGGGGRPGIEANYNTHTELERAVVALKLTKEDSLHVKRHILPTQTRPFLDFKPGIKNV